MVAAEAARSQKQLKLEESNANINKDRSSAEVNEARREACDSNEASLVNRNKVVVAEMTIARMNNEISRLQVEHLVFSQSSGTTNEAVGRMIEEREALRAELQNNLNSPFEIVANLSRMNAVLETQKEEREKTDMLLEDSDNQRRLKTLMYRTYLKELSDGSGKDCQVAVERILTVQTELAEGKKCLTDLSESDDHTQAGSRLWQTLCTAMHVHNLDEPV